MLNLVCTYGNHRAVKRVILQFVSEEAVNASPRNAVNNDCNACKVFGLVWKGVPLNACLHYDAS